MNRKALDQLFEPDLLTQNLSHKSVLGGIIAVGSQVAQLVLSIIGMAVVARILTPSDYGLIGMVTVVVGFAEMFKDAGLAYATIQKEVINPEQISTLFWLNIMISAFLGLCIMVGSPLVSLFYGKPELTAVTAVLSVTFIISGLSIQHQALLQRNLRFASLATIQITSQLITLIVTVTLALLGWRYWALVGGAISKALAGTLLTFFICPWIPGRMKKGTGIRGMLKFGGHLTVSNMINYFSTSMDSILIGKFIGAYGLGLYSRAYLLFMMPMSQIRTPLNRVFVPVLSSLQKQPDLFLKYFQRFMDVLATLMVPITLYCILEADFIITLLLGPQWDRVVPIFRILAITGIAYPIGFNAGTILLSLGLTKRYIYWSLFTGASFIISFAIGIPFGIEGVAKAFAIATYLIIVPSLWICIYRTNITFFVFIRALFWPLLFGMIALGVALFSKLTLHIDSIIGHVFILIVFAITFIIGSLTRKSFRNTVKFFLTSLLFHNNKEVNEIASNFIKKLRLTIHSFRTITPYAVNIALMRTFQVFDTWRSRLLMMWWGIKIGNNSVFFGTPIYKKHPTSFITIGNDCIFRSAEWSNPIGLNRRCFLYAERDANIHIGDKCGFSALVISASLSITIGNRVICGANCSIIDSDRHPLDPNSRTQNGTVRPEPIVIEDDVWLGMNVVVLKGCTIGAGTVVAANSVVTRSLPAGILAGGIPARFIKELNNDF
jgi:O-antigen/teichoic acid export membrane protein/acetyltransferase-like isoleucine patch superfamily enzyme